MTFYFFPAKTVDQFAYFTMTVEYAQILVSPLDPFITLRKNTLWEPANAEEPSETPCLAQTVQKTQSSILKVITSNFAEKFKEQTQTHISQNHDSSRIGSSLGWFRRAYIKNVQFLS